MRSPPRLGAYLICSGIFMALVPVLAWIPTVFSGAAPETRDISAWGSITSQGQ
jgi:hypothetical protein